MGLKNPIGNAIRTHHVYLDTPETQRRIADLERELSAEKKNSKVEIREVERVVVKEDPDLLLRYNAAMRELGAMKMDVAKNVVERGLIEKSQAEAVMKWTQSAAVVQAVQHDPCIEIREVEKVSQIVHIKRELDKKLLAACIVAALGFGGFSGAYLHGHFAKPPVIQAMEIEKVKPVKNVRPSGR